MPTKRAITNFLLLGATTVAAGMLVTPAEAQRGTGTVSVCSRYGAGCISAPVRQGRNGREIRLPGGTWIECKGDCRNTLREETLDFFETLRERAPDGNGRR